MITFAARVRILIGAAVCASACVGTVALASPEQNVERLSPAQTEELATRSAALVRAAPIPLGGIPINDSAKAAQTAEQLAADIPLPPGGNFNGIRWDLAPGVTRSDVEFTLEYNAACQWARAAADGRTSEVATAVLEQVADWPALRLTETAFVWQQRAKDVAAGLGAPAECVAQLAREQAHAKAQGLTPTR
jgi:hypothetical protein